MSSVRCSILQSSPRFEPGECLDHVVVLNETHLRRLLSAYLIFYHGARTHLSLEKDAREPRQVERPVRRPNRRDADGRRPPSSLLSASGVSSCLRAVPATLTSPVGACVGALNPLLGGSGRSQGGPRWVSLVSEAHDQGPQPVPRYLDRLNGRDTRGLHDETVRSVLSRFRGREVETAGDSFLAVFDGAARAVRCGAALVVATAAIDLAIRVGIHSGDVEIGGTGGVRGLAVNTAARVLALASSGEVLVSSTTRDLAEGSSLRFASRGRHELKGLEGERELFLFTEM